MNIHQEKTTPQRPIHSRPADSHNRRAASSIFVMIAIMLSVVIIPSWLLISHCHTDTIQTQHETYKTDINTAVERWVKEKGRWPLRDLSDIASDKDYFPEGIPINPITHQPYRIDRVTHLAR